VITDICGYDEPLLGYITLSINCDIRFQYAIGGSLEFAEFVLFVDLKKIRYNRLKYCRVSVYGVITLNIKLQ
jgi:hypothetical protein